MVKTIMVTWIPGFMVGLEWCYEDGMIVFDLGIVRIIIDYWGMGGPEE